MTQPLLSLRGVTKRYGQVQANSGVDLDVAYGAIPFVIAMIGMVFLLLAVPEMALYLPSLVY